MPMKNLTSIRDEFGEIEQYFDRPCPPFWVAKPEQGMAFVESLKSPTVRTIGHSAGGREIIAIEYGEKEPLDVTTDNLHSALASKTVPPDPTEIYPEAFFGAHRRNKPVMIMQGGIHGSELTGTVGSLNLCHVIETGADLRGKAWPRLAELARNMRLCVIPWLNPDGTARWPFTDTTGVPVSLLRRINQGVAADGTKYVHPSCKKVQPMPPESTDYMGAYYNDNGVNLQYDVMSLERQPETQAWMKYYLGERPDGVVVWHCNAGSLLGPPEYYLPPGLQVEISRLAGAVRARLLREGFGNDVAGRLSWQLPGMGKPYVEQTTAVYQVCGATPLLTEVPQGTLEAGISCDQMLDLCLFLMEEVLNYAMSDGLRAYESRYKVIKQGSHA